MTILDTTTVNDSNPSETTTLEYKEKAEDLWVFINVSSVSGGVSVSIVAVDQDGTEYDTLFSKTYTSASKEMVLIKEPPPILKFTVSQSAGGNSGTVKINGISSGGHV